MSGKARAAGLAAAFCVPPALFAPLASAQSNGRSAMPPEYLLADDDKGGEAFGRCCDWWV